MDILLKQVKIIDHRSAYHKKKLDILIKNGIIKRIAKSIKKSQSIQVFDEKNTHVSIGWFDIGTQVGEPGFEHRETLRTIAKAATKGGYTGIACFPNTSPPLHSKSEIQYIKNNTKEYAIDFHPIGAISKSCKGEELSEMLDMHHAGAVAFSDGYNVVANSGLMLRALEYVKTFNGTIISPAINCSIAKHGIMHEGVLSTQLGVTGIPSIAEKIAVQRDIELGTYANSRILIHNISTPEALQLVKQARRKKVEVFNSASYLNLVATDENLRDFNPNFKVIPPLRSEPQRTSLVKALQKKEIDIISSNHVPIDAESKEKEFYYSSFGAIGLETCYAALQTFCRKEVSIENIILALSIGPRKAIGLDIPKLEPGEEANLTLFNPKAEWTYKEDSIQSKSRNSPYLNQAFVGKPIGIVNRNQFLT